MRWVVCGLRLLWPPYPPCLGACDEEVTAVSLEQRCHGVKSSAPHAQHPVAVLGALGRLVAALAACSAGISRRWGGQLQMRYEARSNDLSSGNAQVSNMMEAGCH